MADLADDLLPPRAAATAAEPAATVADALAASFRALGAVRAFGVCGGAQALLWAALSRHLDLLHFRHECGAAFAAAEAYFAGGRPVVLFTTTGPGITNALTGVLAARDEGAKVILVSAYASAPQRGRWGIQETSGYTMPTGGLFEPGALFNDAVIVETPEQLPQILRRMAHGLARPGGYVAHLSVPNMIQSARLERPLADLLRGVEAGVRLSADAGRPAVNPKAVARAVELLSEGPFAIWAGFGARGAAEPVRRLAERMGAPVMCSPRAKGIIPEDHPLFVGVTGMGGHAPAVGAFMRGGHAPLRTLVLGTRLGEPTSFWNPAMVPGGGFVHVDVDPNVPGVAYPGAETYAVQADAGDFVEALLAAEWPARDALRAIELPRPHPEPTKIEAGEGAVRPEALFAAIQRAVVDGGDAVVLAESGNAFTWATHHLRFAEPKRYRVSTGVGSMGHAATGVVGAALARGGKAVAIVGDGSMLMFNEVNTAVKREVPAVWIVLNDGRYNMCHQGMGALNMQGLADACFPAVDFAMFACAMGAGALRVEHEDALEGALEQAMAALGPFVIDVMIDADRPAPSLGRNEGLRAAKQKQKREDGVSFPVSAGN